MEAHHQDHSGDVVYVFSLRSNQVPLPDKNHGIGGQNSALDQIVGRALVRHTDAAVRCRKDALNPIEVVHPEN